MNFKRNKRSCQLVCGLRRLNLHQCEKFRNSMQRSATNATACNECNGLQRMQRPATNATVCNGLQRTCDGLQRLADQFPSVCNPLRHLVCRGMRQFTMICNCLHKLACICLPLLALSWNSLLVYNFSTGTSFTCGLPKVLKAERSTDLVSHLENLDPGIEINKRTCLKLETQISSDSLLERFKNPRKAILLYTLFCQLFYQCCESGSGFIAVGRIQVGINEPKKMKKWRNVLV